jgi:hypothetical protein
MKREMEIREPVITITLQGENLGECIRLVGGMQKSVATATSEELVEELRRRLRPQGLAVNIEAAAPAVETDELDPKPTNGDAAAADKPKRGRPPKPKAEAAQEAQETAPQASRGNGAAVTREQVIEALGAYAKAHGGQVAARQVMQDVAGVTRLIDVKPEDYDKLVAKLTG